MRHNILITFLFIALFVLSILSLNVVNAKVVSRTVVTNDLELMRIDGLGGSTTTNFQTVSTFNTYDELVVACNYILPQVLSGNNNFYDKAMNRTKDFAVIRIQNVSGNSFDIAAQSHNSGGDISLSEAHCVIAEAGKHSIPDKNGDPNLNVFAGTFTVKFGNIAASSDISGAQSNIANGTYNISQFTDGSLSNNGTPTLLSQVMSFESGDFFTAWNHECDSRINFGDANIAGDACVSMHTGRNSRPNENNYNNNKETVGYIAIDQGSGVTSRNVYYEAFYQDKPGGRQGVRDITATGQKNFSLSRSYRHAVGDQNGEEGGDMAWLVQHNIDAGLAAGHFRFGLDDGNRSHVDEFMTGFAAYQDTVDLHITKTVSNETPQIGDVVTFSLEVFNEGPDDALRVNVDDILPAGFTYVDGSISGGTTQTVTGNSLNWMIDQLDASQTVTLNFDVLIENPSP